ncbi:Uncharacterized protein Tcan_08368 [Toxocara canis]|uniref:Major sperm protein n=2 Tax=Toxocara canis TaxID=6265 RepID=A0A0B2W0N8_TOXCA|nr:Uncharacterized protein Tcan_08368 [Toxocara canis]VDM40296.1 unnamed protein product [Toxocara canis]
MIELCPNLVLLIALHMVMLYTVCMMCASEKRPQMKAASASKQGSKSGKMSASKHSSKSAKQSARKSAKSKKGERSSKSTSASKSERSLRSSKSGKTTQSKKSSKAKDAQQSSRSARIAKASKCVPAARPILAVEPEDLRWTKEGGAQLIHVSNLTNERHAVKVKCSDNYLYSVNPVYAIVEPGGKIDVEVMRNNGDLKLDEMVFVTTKANMEDQQAKALFAHSSGNPAAIVPLLSAAAS